MIHYTLERFGSGTRRVTMHHRIVDPAGQQIGPTFGDISGPREAEPWLKALNAAFSAGRRTRQDAPA